MKRSLGMALMCFTFGSALAQDISPYDSSDILEQVVVRGFENNRRLVDVPAAVSVVGNAQLNRFSNISILPALNMQAGVRMEERSPGSYRLNIRGSSLRSPFGVRNIKVYYNGIPYTDPGGNTFLNSLGFYNVQSAEIIRGPGSSLYGAGTGGVMLISSETPNWSAGLTADYSRGSYGLHNRNLNIRFGSESFRNTLNYQDMESDGYREHTAMTRKVFTWDASARVGDRSRLQAHVLYSDLYYQTPGALTGAEFAINPRSARPRTGPTPSSAEARAAIFTKNFLAGFNIEHQFSERFKNTTSVYAAFSELRNPTIRNYERRTEPHTGGRTTFEYTASPGEALVRIQLGAEMQQGFSTVRVATNQDGQPGQLQTEDEIGNRLASLFAQVITELPGNWTITAGASINQLKVAFNRISQVPIRTIDRRYQNEVAPRLALLKKVHPNVSVYTSVSKGFSPPTTGELLPSTSVISTGLKAEEGWNFEVGTRGSLLANRFYFDINAFYFRLQNTIVQRRDANGADYFVNAGSTNQKGVETNLNYRLIPESRGFVRSARIWVSHTFHHFRYDSYAKVGDDTADYSGNRLPSVAPHIFVAGLDIATAPGFYANVTYYYSDRIALTDANNFYASSFNLLGLRAGHRMKWSGRITTDLFASGDNLFDTRYSLGNDINAFGNRFFNAAAGRNFIVGASLKIDFN